MELETEIVSAKFTSPRDVTIVSADGGQCAIFQAGQTRTIPKRLFDAALLAGLVPEGSIVPEPLPIKKPTQKEAVSAGLLTACKTLILRGIETDFTKVGQPRVPAVRKLVDFDFTNRDLREAFELAMHEVEHNGDDSTEHSE